MKIINTQDPQAKPPVVMLVYGEGGVGKTTFASTAPKPILADCENGAKYFGLRGISVDVAQIQKWADMKEFYNVAVKNDYETIVIDPIGELMEKLMDFMKSTGNRKLLQTDGNPTMAGWGWLKQTMRQYLKLLRDSGKHILIVAHVAEKGDEDRILKRPLIMTKLSEELINMVDIVGYMTIIQDGEESKRVILVDPTSDKFVAKDRTGQLGTIIPPDFKQIIKAVQGTEKYKWSNPNAIVKTQSQTTEKKPKPEKKSETKTKEPAIIYDQNDEIFQETAEMLKVVKDPKTKKEMMEKIIKSGQFNAEQIKQLQKI